MIHEEIRLRKVDTRRCGRVADHDGNGLAGGTAWVGTSAEGCASWSASARPQGSSNDAGRCRSMGGRSRGVAPSGRELDHLIITRFNLRIREYGPAVDDDWLRHRLGLFRSFTLPSVRASADVEIVPVARALRPGLIPVAPLRAGGRVRRRGAPDGGVGGSKRLSRRSAPTCATALVW